MPRSDGPVDDEELLEWVAEGRCQLLDLGAQRAFRQLQGGARNSGGNSGRNHEVLVRMVWFYQLVSFGLRDFAGNWRA